MGGEGEGNGMMDSSTDSGHKEPILRYSAGRGGADLYCRKIQK